MGGGFRGFTAARRLERILSAQAARVTLVNDVNFMLYTPLLSPWRRQFLSVCSDTPRSAAACFSGVPDRIGSTASRRNSDRYGGRALGIWTSFLPEPLRPKRFVHEGGSTPRRPVS